MGEYKPLYGTGTGTEVGATLLCGDEVATGGMNRRGSAVNPLNPFVNPLSVFWFSLLPAGVFISRSLITKSHTEI